MPYNVKKTELDLVRVQGARAGMQASFAEFEKILDEGRYFVVLSDMRSAKRPDKATQAKIGRWLLEHQKKMDEFCLAWAIVVDNPLKAAVVSDLDKSNPHAYPLEYFRSEEDALHFLAPYRIQ